MHIKSYIGIKWASRKENAEACAIRLAGTLHDLADINPAFSSWSDVNHGSKFVPVDTEVPALAAALSVRVQRTEVAPRRIIEALGFNWWIRSDEGAWKYIVFQIHCGCFSKEIPNSCILELPRDGIHSYRSLHGLLKAKIFRALIANWDPEGGSITSGELYTAIKLQTGEQVHGRFGWVTYVPCRLEMLPNEVRNTYYIEEVPSRGVLIYVSKEAPQDESAPEFVAAAVCLFRMLEGNRVWNTSSEP
jgi:hypothetical protein